MRRGETQGYRDVTDRKIGAAQQPLGVLHTKFCNDFMEGPSKIAGDDLIYGGLTEKKLLGHHAQRDLLAVVIGDVGEDQKRFFIDHVSGAAIFRREHLFPRLLRRHTAPFPKGAEHGIFRGKTGDSGDILGGKAVEKKDRSGDAHSGSGKQPMKTVPGDPPQLPVELRHSHTYRRSYVCGGKIFGTELGDVRPGVPARGRRKGQRLGPESLLSIQELQLTAQGHLDQNGMGAGLFLNLFKFMKNMEHFALGRGRAMDNGHLLHGGADPLGIWHPVADGGQKRIVQNQYPKMQDIVLNGGEAISMLAFLAPDQDKLRDLQTEVKRFIAWKSIISDKDDLNLDGGQLREADSSLNRSNNLIETRMKETYCWLLVPFIDQYEDIKTIHWEISNLGGGNDEIVSKAAKKMIQSEQIITTWAPALLKMSLDELLWKDSDNIMIKKLWEYLCTYCYLPRLANYSVLEDAIAKGVHSTEFFGIAAGYTGERYIDLKLNETVYSINQSDLLVKPAIAMKQIMEERNAAGQGGGMPDPPDITGGRGNGTTDGQSLTGGLSGHSGDGTETGAVPKNTRFFMSAKLDNTRVNKNVNDYLTEIIQHLMSVDGADVELTLEVSVNAPGGIPSSTVRTVSENCRTLKIQDFGFEGC